MAGISLRDAEAARLQITREQAAEVQGLYRSVYREYRKQLKSLTSGGATTSLRKTQLRKLTEELKTAYEGLGRQLEGNITSAVTQTSQAVVQANNSWMSGMGLKITGAYAHVPQDIVTLLSSGKLYSDGWTLSKAIWGESQQKAHEIDLIVAKGVAANKSAFEIAKDLESYVNPGAIKPWDWSKVYPGTSKRVDYNAQRLARTMVSHAYQQSLERVCNKNPFVIGYKWRSAHTARTCEICNQRSTEDHHGLGPGVYPKGELPLDHPNGMCTFLTVMSDDLMGISNRLADWANGKEDSALDKWYNSASGKPENKPVTQQEKRGAVEKKPSFNSEEYIAKNLSGLESRFVSQYGEQAARDLHNHLLGLSETQLKWLSSGEKRFKGFFMDGDKCYFERATNRVCVSQKDLSRDESRGGQFHALFHEYGHFLDKVHAGINIGFSTSPRGKAIYSSMEKEYNSFIKGLTGPKRQELMKDDYSRGVQDMMSSLGTPIRWGHSEQYWNQKGQSKRWVLANLEAFANLNAAYLTGGKEEEWMKQYFPETYELFIQEVEKLVGKV